MFLLYFCETIILSYIYYYVVLFSKTFDSQLMVEQFIQLIVLSSEFHSTYSWLHGCPNEPFVKLTTIRVCVELVLFRLEVCT